MDESSDELIRSLALYKGLVEVSGLINAITSSEELLPAILDIARRVVSAEGSSLFLINEETGELELTIARSPNGEVTEAHLVIPRGHGIAGWVLEHNTATLVADAYADNRFYQAVDKKTGIKTRSIICAPLNSDGAPVGVIQVLNPTNKEGFDQQDLEAIEAYASLAATAIAKVRLIEREKIQARLERDLALAEEIQQSFLPHTLPDSRDLTFAAHYRPARNIGGDFYDVFELSDDELVFVVGDVSGKGMPAALMMAQALSALRLILRPDMPLTAAMELWNQTLIERNIRRMFITALLGRIVPSTGVFDYCLAGHSSPILCPQTGDAHETKSDGAPPLGVLRKLSCPTNTVTLTPGDIVVAYTDGLSESFTPQRETLEKEGILEIISRSPHSSHALCDALRDGEASHRNGAEPGDDLTILTIALRPSNELRVLSAPANMAAVRGFVRDQINRHSLAESDRELITLAVDEACTNVIRHAYQDRDDQPIHITIDATDDILEIRIRDYGTTAPVAEMRARDLDDVRPGGLGLHFMLTAFESVDYQEADPGTELVMTRALHNDK